LDNYIQVEKLREKMNDSYESDNDEESEEDGPDSPILTPREKNADNEQVIEDSSQ